MSSASLRTGEGPGEPGTAPALEFAYFVRRLRELSGFDLGQYKPEQVERRARQWMARRGIASLAALVRLLERDAEARSDLIDYLAINTSQFFRDPNVFAAIESRVLPHLLAEFGRLRIWSAGCSIGAEPYTVAILLHRMGQQGRHLVLGTDIDDEALAVARSGVYHDVHLMTVPADVRNRYFTAAGPAAWQLAEHIRRAVQFRRHDLLQDPCPGGFHLVLCRHVLIYLTHAAQARVVRCLSQALTCGGYLVIGGPETIARPDEFGLERVEHCIYRKPAPHRISSGS